MEDQRDKCKCHKGCTTEPHYCRKPCMWPNCLNPEQTKELLDEIQAEE
jgi:hypothetical protein